MSRTMASSKPAVVREATAGADYLGDLVADLAQVGIAGHAVEPGHAVDEDSGGEDAQQEILDGGFVGELVAAGKAGEDIDGDGHQLDADEEGGEVGGRRGEHHAAGGEGQHRVIFAERHALSSIYWVESNVPTMPVPRDNILKKSPRLSMTIMLLNDCVLKMELPMYVVEIEDADNESEHIAHDAHSGQQRLLSRRPA